MDSLSGLVPLTLSLSPVCTPRGGEGTSETAFNIALQRYVLI